MSASYAGAVAAIQASFTSRWTETPVALQNEKPKVWPPLGDDGWPVPHVYFEVLGGGSAIRGAGRPGALTWVYHGWLHAHVFVPSNTGTDDAFRLAAAAGELFRSEVFYRDTPGCYVRTGAGTHSGNGPRVDGGGDGDHEGSWFRVTMTCPFEYWHRG